MGNPQIFTPFYQVKSGGMVVEQTNRIGEAEEAYRESFAHPVEMWQVHSNGSAVLMEQKRAMRLASA